MVVDQYDQLPIRHEGIHCCLTSSSLPPHPPPPPHPPLIRYLYFLLLPSLIVVGGDGLFSGLLPRLRRSDEFITASPHHNPHNYIITTPSEVGAVWSVVRICAREGGVVRVCDGRVFGEGVVWIATTHLHLTTPLMASSYHHLNTPCHLITTHHLITIHTITSLSPPLGANPNEVHACRV